MTYHNDTTNPLTTFANDADEQYAILLGVMAALTKTKAEDMTIPGVDSEEICRIVVEERPYLLGGYYAVRVLDWLHPRMNLISDGIHANDVHAFVYGIDSAMKGQTPERYSAELSPEGVKDISSSPDYYAYGISAGKIVRWFV